MRAHLCLVAPHGYEYSMVLNDPLSHFQFRLQRMGIPVTVGRNSLQRESVNFVFGAHLGLDERWLRGHDCVLVNLEQLGEAGTEMPAEYLRLLEVLPVVDYHSLNLPAYGADPETTPVVRFGYADYLAAPAAPLEERPIDVLFIGSMTPRRRDVFQELEAQGHRITAPAASVFGPARDDLIRNAKAVINVSAFESTRFEQVRASVVLSCGTPMITEDRGWTHADDAWAQQYVHHFDPADPGGFFRDHFGSPEFYRTSRDQLDRWAEADTTATFQPLGGLISR